MTLEILSQNLQTNHPPFREIEHFVFIIRIIIINLLKNIKLSNFKTKRKREKL